jgi:hypothetical protein
MNCSTMCPADTKRCGAGNRRAPFHGHRVQYARRFGLHTPRAQLLRKGLSPAMQVSLAGIQALADHGLGSHAQMDMWVLLVLVQHHHIAVVVQFRLCELSRRP